MIECNYYSPPSPHPDRSDYVPTITQELSFVHALERLIGCVGYIYPATRRTLSLEFYRLFLSLSLTIIFFPKSAQLPLSSRLLNATSAPTPVSPPSHSPTTVIAGVYSGSIMQPIIMLVIDEQ